jgi:hypothetical protein
VDTRIKKIPELLRLAISGDISNSEINEFVSISTHLASTRLRQMKSSGKLFVDALQLSLDFAALDCIADIFQRDEEGIFIKINEYFSKEKDIEILSDEQVIFHYTRIIISKLNDSLFHYYYNNDPILSNIIRALKRAIKSDEKIRTFKRFGKTCIFSCDEIERHDELPEIPFDEFENLIYSTIKSAKGTKYNLEMIFEILNGQTNYRKFYDLNSIALILKRLCTIKKVSLDKAFYLMDDISSEEITRSINEAIHSLENRLKEKYVESNKMATEVFDKHFSAVREIIFDSILYSNGSDIHYYNYLKKQIPDMEYEEYRQKFRIQFEYMLKISKTYIKESLREKLL